MTTCLINSVKSMNRGGGGGVVVSRQTCSVGLERSSHHTAPGFILLKPLKRPPRAGEWAQICAFQP